MPSWSQYSPCMTTASNRSSPTLSASLATALSTLASWKSWAIDGTKAVAKSVYSKLSKVRNYLATTTGDLCRWLITSPIEDSDEEEKDSDQDLTAFEGPPEGTSTENQPPVEAEEVSREAGDRPQETLAADTLAKALTKLSLTILKHVHHPLPQNRWTFDMMRVYQSYLFDWVDRSWPTTGFGDQDQNIRAATEAIALAQSRWEIGVPPEQEQCYTCNITKPLSQLAKGLLTDLGSRYGQQYAAQVEDASLCPYERSSLPSAQGQDDLDMVVTVEGTPHTGDQPLRLALSLGCSANMESLVQNLSLWGSLLPNRPESVLARGGDSNILVKTWHLPGGPAAGDVCNLSHTFIGDRGLFAPVSKALDRWGKAKFALGGPQQTG